MDPPHQTWNNRGRGAGRHLKGRVPGGILSQQLLEAFERHSPERIRAALLAGASPHEPIRGKTPMLWLVEMYTRSDRFADCLRVMLDAGASLDDSLLTALLLDDDESLRERLAADSQALGRRFALECSYTSLDGVSALHVCAEYNSVRCVRALLAAGHEVDSRADVDHEGTVNSNGNHCRGAMELLVEAGASLDLRLKGVRWGRGFEWETLVLDVTPLSYAQCGLYAQFHRREADVYANLEYLSRKRYETSPAIPNVPNRYLARG
jgi:Ankyrin repeat